MEKYTRLLLKIKYNKEKYNQEKSGNGVEYSVEYPTWQYYMVRQINKLFYMYIYNQINITWLWIYD